MEIKQLQKELKLREEVKEFNYLKKKREEIKRILIDKEGYENLLNSQMRIKHISKEEAKAWIKKYYKVINEEEYDRYVINKAEEEYKKKWG